MSLQPTDDLFDKSKMTFGEHLEELRSCLIKSLLGVLVGLGFGLMVSKYIVQVIKEPLEESLQGYYQIDAVTRYADFAAEREREGKAIPYSVEHVRQMVDDDGYLYTMYLVHPRAVRIELGLDKPAAEKTSNDSTHEAAGNDTTHETAGATAGGEPLGIADLVPLFVWRKMTDDERVSVTALNAPEAFMIWLKAALVSGIVIASPWIFYQLWSFVAAGLYPHERNYVHVFLPFSIILFLAGALFCFFAVFPFILDFLFSFNADLGIDPDPRISEWLSFAIFLPLGFGISFQLPLVMLFLERIGVFDVAAYLSKWRIAVLVIFVLAMFLTPADPMSMLAMALPLTALYFGGIALCAYWPKRKGMLEE